MSISRRLAREGRQPVTLVDGAGCGARGPGFVSRTLGRHEGLRPETLWSPARSWLTGAFAQGSESSRGWPRSGSSMDQTEGGLKGLDLTVGGT